MIYQEFDAIGRDLFAHALNNSHSGNISALQGGRITITASGSMLHRLGWQDLVEVGINDTAPSRASRELVVHREIYRRTNALAVVHAHPPFTIALAAQMNPIVPEDAEGAYYFGAIPVIDVSQAIGSDEVAERVPAEMVEKRTPLVVVRNHGVFSAGLTLWDAYQWISSLEHSCRILMMKSAGRHFWKDMGS